MAKIFQRVGKRFSILHPNSLCCSIEYEEKIYQTARRRFATTTYNYPLHPATNEGRRDHSSLCAPRTLNRLVLLRPLQADVVDRIGLEPGGRIDILLTEGT